MKMKSEIVSATEISGDEREISDTKRAAGSRSRCSSRSACRKAAARLIAGAGRNLASPPDGGNRFITGKLPPSDCPAK